MTRLSILAIGQSNMEGRYGPAQSVPAHGRVVRAWDWSASVWLPATLGQRPFKSVLANTAPAHNLAFDAAHRIAAACDVDVDLTLLASGGKRAEFFLPNVVLNAHGWMNTDSDPDFGMSLADEIFGADGAARRALNANGDPHYHAVLIHQGEANFTGAAADASADYAAKVTAIIDTLDVRHFTTPETPVILGEINPGYLWAGLHKEAVWSLASPRVGVVSWDGVEDVRSVAGEPNNHATGRGLTTLGARYAAAMLTAMARRLTT